MLDEIPIPDPADVDRQISFHARELRWLKSLRRMLQTREIQESNADENHKSRQGGNDVQDQ